MQEVLFNSRSRNDKLPQGAGVCGRKIKFGLSIATELQALNVYFIITNDADGSVRRQMMGMTQCKNDYTRFECEIAVEACGLFWYCFQADTTQGTKFIGKSENCPYFCDDTPAQWQLTVCTFDYTTPKWIMGGGFYHIFVDRFNRGGDRPVRQGSIFRSDWGGTPDYLPDSQGEILNNDFFGGDLVGITKKLPYLQELGISCLYLSPIFEAASNHKYDTGDYMKIDPSFGDEEDFKTLCAQAKEMGIGVILDGVFNHTGSDSLYFNQLGHYDGGGAYGDPNSPYYRWYSFTNWPDEYEAWWGIKTLPQVREGNPSYQEFILGNDGVLRKWIGLGASGWRLDVADELPDFFLEKTRASLKAFDPNALLLGEVWEDATTKIAYGQRRHYFDGSQLDSVMNYPFKNAIIDYMKTGNAKSISETVETICENYPKPALDCLMNGLGTHDTSRIITVLGGKEFPTRQERADERMSIQEYEAAKAKLMTACLIQCTLPGVPCIFYGDEVGLQGYEDPFNRRCYPWGDEDTQLRAWYTSLLNTRRSCPAFAGGDYETLAAKNGVFAFSRVSEAATAYVVVNLGSGALSFVLPDDCSPALLLSCQQVNDRLELLPGGGAIIEKCTSQL